MSADLDIRRLASCVVLQALGDLRAHRRAYVPKLTASGDRFKNSNRWETIPQVNDCTGHWQTCRCAVCARDYFYGHLADAPEPMNFLFCCRVLELDPEAVVSKLDAGVRVPPTRGRRGDRETMVAHGADILVE